MKFNIFSSAVFGSAFGCNVVRHLAEELSEKSNEDIIRIDICTDREEIDALNFISELNEKFIYNDFDIDDKGRIKSIIFSNLNKPKYVNLPMDPALYFGN